MNELYGIFSEGSNLNSVLFEMCFVNVKLSINEQSHEVRVNLSIKKMNFF